jgi:hypothetical protein
MGTTRIFSQGGTQFCWGGGDQKIIYKFMSMLFKTIYTDYPKVFFNVGFNTLNFSYCDMAAERPE